MRNLNQSVQRLARIAGALYLVNIVAGAFAMGYVSSVAPTIHATVWLLVAGVNAARWTERARISSTSLAPVTSS